MTHASSSHVAADKENNQYRITPIKEVPMNIISFINTTKRPTTSNSSAVKKFYYPDQRHSGPQGWVDWRSCRAEPLKLNDMA